MYVCVLYIIHYILSIIYTYIYIYRLPTSYLYVLLHIDDPIIATAEAAGACESHIRHRPWRGGREGRHLSFLTFGVADWVRGHPSARHTCGGEPDFCALDDLLPVPVLVDGCGEASAARALPGVVAGGRRRFMAATRSGLLSAATLRSSLRFTLMNLSASASASSRRRSVSMMAVCASWCSCSSWMACALACTTQASAGGADEPWLRTVTRVYPLTVNAALSAMSCHAAGVMCARGSCFGGGWICNFARFPIADSGLVKVITKPSFKP